MITNNDVLRSRLNFSTAFSSNVISICKSIQLDKVTRVEISTRYHVVHNGTLDQITESKVCKYINYFYQF